MSFCYGNTSLHSLKVSTEAGQLHTCNDCGAVTKPANIVELMEHYRDRDGWIICECGERGYVKKDWELQEGTCLKLCMHRVSRLTKDLKDPYQPLAFWVSYESPDEPIESVWFSYYKDLSHKEGGRLKMGYGPGGPPVVDISEIYALAEELKRQGL